jgi:hydroxymethylbilane synthase
LLGPGHRPRCGVFVSALREALVAGEVDAALHSYKDLPTAADPRLILAAVPERADPRDALVARDGIVLDELPPGAVLGTSSPRRAAQLRALGVGLQVVPMRGNVDSRIRRVVDGELDGVVVAAAGLARLGRIAEATELLDPQRMLPAPGQGALACECRVDDRDTAHALTAVLNDTRVRAAVTAERALLAALEAGCSAPVGALADVIEDLDDDGRWRCGCPYGASQPLRMVTCSGRPPRGSSPMPRTSAASLRRSCWTWVPARRAERRWSPDSHEARAWSWT